DIGVVIRVVVAGGAAVEDHHRPAGGGRRAVRDGERDVQQLHALDDRQTVRAQLDVAAGPDVGRVAGLEVGCLVRAVVHEERGGRIADDAGDGGRGERADLAAHQRHDVRRVLRGEHGGVDDVGAFVAARFVKVVPQRPVSGLRGGERGVGGRVGGGDGREVGG